MKRISKKYFYMLSLLVISLLMIIIVPTYAKFGSNYVTEDDIVGVALNFDISISNIEEYEELVIPAGETKKFNVEVTNSSGGLIYYGIWYRMVEPTTINDDISIGRLYGSTTTTSGSIENGGVTTPTIVITNNSSSQIKVNIGVGSSATSTSDIEYLNGKYLITGELKVYPNSPNLDTGLIPVYYDNGVWKKADSTNTNESWYDYSEKKWANAILKDSNTVVDLSNNLNNGTISGATWDRANKTVTTDGVDDYIDLGLANYDFGNDFSYVIRFKLNSIKSGVYNVIMGNPESAGADIYIDKDGTLKFEIASSTTSEYIYYNTGFYPALDTWYTVVAIKDYNRIYFYINGESVTNTAGNSSNLSTDYVVSSVPIGIGINFDLTNVHEHYSNITVSDALVFDRALTASEVASNYSGVPNPVDKTDLLIHYDFSDYNDIPVNTVLGDNDNSGTLAFYVWIPRYKYRVWNITRQGGAETTYAYSAFTKGIDIEWENGTASTGNVSCRYDTSTSVTSTVLSDKCSYEGTEITTDSGNKNYTNAWYTHPAFTFGNKPIEGFWIGKFETSGTASKPLIVPDMLSLNGQDMSTKFTTSKKFQNYGLSSDIDSHVLTNLEWGAVAYLTHSIYGLCNGTSCDGVYINNSYSSLRATTGRSGGAIAGSTELNLVNVYGSSNTTATTKYNTTGYYTYKGYFIEYDGTINTTTDKLDESKVASTTRNVTGVYDMSGGMTENLMGNMVDSNGDFYLASAGNSWNGSSSLDIKYYNSYSYYSASSSDQVSFNRARLGDATAEVKGSSSYVSYPVWKPGVGGGVTGTSSNFVYNTSPWFSRGGSASSTTSGIFVASSNSGSSGIGYAFRSALS